MKLFNFKKRKNTIEGVAFTCRHFIYEGKEITYISHKENGDYECFCSECEKKIDLSAIMVVRTDEIFHDNNKNFLDIEKGKYNYLQDDKWYEKNFDKNDEYFAYLFDIEEKIINENIKRNKVLRSDLSGIMIKR